MCVKFITNASTSTIGVQVQRDSTSELFSNMRGDDIMSYNGQNGQYGIDIYAYDDGTGYSSSLGGYFRWIKTSESGSQDSNETLYLGDIYDTSSLNGNKMRSFMVYFPTHVPVLSMKIGVPSDAVILPYVTVEPNPANSANSALKSRKSEKNLPFVASRSAANPLLIWGSSIAQGGVVQNPGMTWPNVLRREMTNLNLSREIWAFGFSGSCRMQSEVAKILVSTHTKPSTFVIDCLPNMNADEVTIKAQPVFKQLKAGLGPDIPIIVLEGRTYANAWILPDIMSKQLAKRSAQKAAFKPYVASSSDKNIHYVTGDGKLQDLGLIGMSDATAGIGVHPTNIPHLHIAKYVARNIADILSTSIVCSSA